MSEIKLLIADVDGTLASRKTRKPGPLTIQALQQLRKEGVLLCVASGRPLWQNLESHYQDWGMGEQFDYLIGMNGGEIWSKKTNTVQEFHPLLPEDIQEIICTMNALEHVNPFIYYDRDVMLSQFADEEMMASALRHQSEDRICKDRSELWQKPTGKVLFRCHSEENAQKAMDYALEKFGSRFAVFKTGLSLLEIQYPDVSKGSGLLQVCKEAGIGLEQVIAFGDAENDIEMLKIAGTSVCLQNGMEDVKEICDAVTEYTVDEDGVGRYLFAKYLK